MNHQSRNKINVVHILLSLEIGGMEQVVADLITHLDPSLFDVTVICVEELGPIAHELRDQGFNVNQIQKKMQSPFSFIYPKELVSLIKTNKIDVVHVHSGCWHKAALAGWLGGVRNIIYTEHGRSFPDSRRQIILERLYSVFTRKVVTVSESLARYMQKEVGIPKTKIATIINGVNVDRFQSARGKAGEPVRRIGIIARLAPVKDIKTLLRAMALLHLKYPKVELVIAGDGDEREALEEHSKELGICGTVLFLGFRRDIPVVLSEIDIFVLSSLSEGTSITLLEAMAAGKPVVVTDVGGNPAVVEDGVNGFLVPPESPEGMAHALICLIEGADVRENMANENIHKIEKKYSVQTMAAQYEKLYCERV